MEPQSEPGAAARAEPAAPGLLDSRGGEAGLGPMFVLLARLGVGVGLALGGFTVAPGDFQAILRLVAWAMAAVTTGCALVAWRWRWTPIEKAEPWIGMLGAAVGGAALGSRGHAGLAVVAVVPLTWVFGATQSRAKAIGAVAAAAVFGALGGASTGHTRGADLVVVVAGLAVAGFVWGAASSTAEDVAVAETERAELRRLRAEMITTISHELRTPLTVIQGATATLNRRWDVLSEAERLDLVDVLTENVASLDASILHFADAARLERGEFVLHPEWVPAREPLEAAMTRRNAPLAGHDIRVDMAVEVVWADRRALERIFEHLLLNAARFSSVGLPITVRLTPGPEEVTLTVADRGQGIAPRLLSTVWEPLQRGDVGETGISRGAGLGLPIVRELARLHGGEATLSSVRGRGTTVSVVLPQPVGGPPPEGPSSGLEVLEPRRGALSRRSG